MKSSNQISNSNEICRVRFCLSGNPSIPPEFAKEHPDKPWKWGVDGFSGTEEWKEYKLP
uniref:Uncharacterized protein n=1 Tax=Marseillevirus LCMAC102 TaxID=2506603 RepID=A0A481YT18_9VIRU|nr:MAG: hypothetical protein LCMAC102_02180 [Marseillevirus LCMAC102]